MKIKLRTCDTGKYHTYLRCTTSSDHYTLIRSDNLTDTEINEIKTNFIFVKEVLEPLPSFRLYEIHPIEHDEAYTIRELKRRIETRGAETDQTSQRLQERADRLQSELIALGNKFNDYKRENSANHIIDLIWEDLNLVYSFNISIKRAIQNDKGAIVSLRQIDQAKIIARIQGALRAVYS
jgi:hypothetical protein